jgi:predicted phage baseplate assembly protein
MTSPHERTDDCDCCEGVTEWTPVAIGHRPGLPALSYRVGTHGSFRATMQASLSRQSSLVGLATREDDDPTIALLDAWATVLDVLTFYQERIANEGYLRTAAEWRSVVELAHGIGYVPSPGRVAATYLAFELATATGAPEQVRIPAGTKVQSVPGPDEEPQTFETTEDTVARPAWNAMAPQRSHPWNPTFGDLELWFEGVATGLSPGDAILIVGDERASDARNEEWDLRFVSEVEPAEDGTRTRVAWQRGLGTNYPYHVEPASENPRVYALRQRAALFGHNAPDWRTMPASIQIAYLGEGDEDWPNLSIEKIANPDDPLHTIYLDAIYPKITRTSWVVLESPKYRELFRPAGNLADRAVMDSSRSDFTLTSKATRITLQGASEHFEKFENQIRETVVLTQSEELPVATVPIPDPVQGSEIALDGVVADLQRGMTVLVTGRRARVEVADDTTIELVTDAGTATLQPRDQLVVTSPSVDSMTHRTWTLRTAAGDTGTATVPLNDDTVVPIPALPTDDLLAETAILGDLRAQPDPLRTTLFLTSPLSGAFDRTSCRISANTALATHGETKKEVLGSGDASRSFQRFGLKQSPLTYVPAPSASGSASSLRVKVNDITWDGEPSLYGLGPKDRAYVVRINDDGVATIEFGDGSTGARPPTGRENVAATYRVGTGTDGNVKAGQLSLLVTRPLGVSRVSNPMAAAGGANPEGLEEARENAPGAVLTFERVVSLPDHADFARAFAGIAKAQAAWLWDGEARLIFVTVAGIDGRDVDQITMQGLTGALASAGDPHRALRVESFESLAFRLKAGVWLRAGYDWETVRIAGIAALREAFSFQRRDLARSVSSSEVVATLQAVDGVLGVDLDELSPAEGPASADPMLPALGARWDGSAIRPAQLRSIDSNEDAIDLVERT